MVQQIKIIALSTTIKHRCLLSPSVYSNRNILTYLMPMTSIPETDAGFWYVIDIMLQDWCLYCLLKASRHPLYMLSVEMEPGQIFILLHSVQKQKIMIYILIVLLF